MDIDVKEMRKQLMSKIDNEDLVEVEKVERYIKLVELNIQLDAEIEKDGLVTVTENGAQRFIKSHPSINEKMKVNSQLINLAKTFNFVNEGIQSSSPSTSTVEDEAPTANDLV